MRKIKVLSVFGTRPEAIKMAPLVKKLEKDERFESSVCVTAQHREMLDSVLDIFNIRPKYDLNIMSHGQTIVDISSKVLKGVTDVLVESKPDVVLVHGDTSTTLNAALASFYNKIPVAHVEAGLRSYDNYSPFPEEINRKLTGSIATLHFCPTESNKLNLLKEGIKEDNIFTTGNTVIDALKNVIKKNYIFDDDLLNNIDFEKKKVILLTTHRRENWGKPMENIFNAIIDLLNNNDNVEVIFPIHKNPSIRDLANRYFKDHERKVHIIEPLEYLDFANLMDKVYLIMTDSGGIQEEAPSLGKPVVVLRTETERPEAVESGTVKLAGIEEEAIFNTVNDLLTNGLAYNKMAHATNPYGTGDSCDKIIKILYSYFKQEN